MFVSRADLCVGLPTSLAGMPTALFVGSVAASFPIVSGRAELKSSSPLVCMAHCAAAACWCRAGACWWRAGGVLVRAGACWWCAGGVLVRAGACWWRAGAVLWCADGVLTAGYFLVLDPEQFRLAGKCMGAWA